ncbi:MAG TPA: DMT family transporter [Candidatus Limnocylindrales bacterium]|jgi:drug/metabolite transporter (DMT)-like permease
MPRAVALGIGLTIVSAFAFGSGALFAKPVYAEGVGWHVLMAWRFLVGASLAMAWLLINPGTRAALLRMRRRDVGAAIALGVLYTGNSGTYFAGLETVSASLAALIVYIYPAIVAVISLQVGQPLRGRRAWGALALALTGVALAVGNIQNAAPPPLSGLVLIALSPVIYSVWIVLAARLSGERRAGAGVDSGTGAVEPMVAGALMLSSTAVTYWVSALALGQPVLPAQIPPGAWFGLVGIGVVSTFIAVLAFYAGAHRIGAARASIVSTVEPIWTISLASLLLAESLGPLQLLGGALILSGVVVAQTGGGSGATATELRIADE